LDLHGLSYDEVYFLRIQTGCGAHKAYSLTGTEGFLTGISGRNIHTLKENVEALVAATREIGLEVSADKTNYMVMS